MDYRDAYNFLMRTRVFLIGYMEGRKVLYSFSQANNPKKYTKYLEVFNDDGMYIFRVVGDALRNPEFISCIGIQEDIPASEFEKAVVCAYHYMMDIKHPRCVRKTQTFKSLINAEKIILKNSYIKSN